MDFDNLDSKIMTVLSVVPVVICQCCEMSHGSHTVLSGVTLLNGEIALE